MVYLYRKNGGQVLAVSVDATAFASVDATYFGTLTDPSTPNGADLGTPRIWDGTVVRTATAPPEQATFVTAAATDDTLQARSAAKAWLQTNPIQRKILRAIVGLVVQQLNVVRQSPTTTFGALTQTQAETAILTAIDAGTFD